MKGITISSDITTSMEYQEIRGCTFYIMTTISHPCNVYDNISC
jgi:hypothetical protein